MVDMSFQASSFTVSRPELLEDDGDQRFRDPLHAFFAHSSRLQAVRKHFASRIGLSPMQYMVLIAIVRLQSRDIGISQIAERLHFTGAFVTIEVNRLVQQGLVKKGGHLEDRRRVVLRSTARGESLLLELASFQRPINDALFRSLNGGSSFSFIA